MYPLEQACNVFDQVEATRSRTQKEALLRSLSGEAADAAKFLLHTALNWDNTYGVTQLPQITKHADAAQFTSVEVFKGLVDHINSGFRLNGEQIAEALASFEPTVEKWLRRCIVKDLQMGTGEATVNTVFPGLIKTFNVMLAEPFDAATMNLQWPLFVEPKIDGVRATAVPTGSGYKFISRGGIEYHNCERISDNLKQIFGANQFVIDGELFVDSVHKTLSATRTIERADEQLVSRLVYFAFDILEKSDWDRQQCEAIYTNRKECLLTELEACSPASSKIIPVRHHMVVNQEQLNSETKKYLDAGFEGSMIKTPGGVYVFDRSVEWLKYKPVETGDFKVTGLYNGTGRNKNRLGGFVISLPNGKQCNVGGGFSDEQRELFWQNPPLGKTIEVEYKRFTPDGLLREPVFVRIREDK